MKSQIIVILAVTLSACNTVSNPHKVNEQATPKPKAKSATPKVTAKAYDKINMKDLIGVWMVKDSENPTFEIKKNTIFYPEHFKSYKYEVIGDSVKIYYDDFNESFAYKFNGRDTLTLAGDDGSYEYYRVKK